MHVSANVLEPRVRRALAFATEMVFALVFAAAASAQGRDAVKSLYAERGVFLDAIARERPSNTQNLAVTGITVPHHILAADLMARGFWAAAGNTYDRVIILAPDHFNKSRRPLATTLRDFETVLGTAENDRAATGALLADGELFEDSALFEKEHGVAALLPFVEHFFPDAKIVPIAISVNATRAHWDRALAAIAKITGPRVLVVQSTDYSHYLTLGPAIQRDQEMLTVIAAGDVEAVTRLVQPDHLDTKAAQYIQMRLQAEILKSHATVIANRNSAEYSALVVETTSYIVTVYAADAEAGSRLRYADQEVLYFGGDTFLGRWLTQPLADPMVARDVVARVTALTGGAPLVVNLEGVLLDEPPETIGGGLHVMHASLATPILAALNVNAASVANNHSFDLGRAGFDEMLSILDRSAIKPLQHGEIVDLGPVRLVALNFIGTDDHRGYPVVEGEDLGEVCGKTARPPLIAFVHWGEEYTTTATRAEYAAAEALEACGVSAVIGAHSHRAAARVEAIRGGEQQLVFSLGNLLFDQRSERGSGALLELRLFKQGTYATRLLPIPNLFEMASGHRKENGSR